MALVASVLVLPLDAPARVLGPDGAAHVAKRKQSRCRGKKVPVKVVGRTRCRSLRSAFPKPKAGDLRLIFAKAALGTNITIRDRKGRKPAPLPAPAKKTLAAMGKVLPRALARYDGLAAAPAAFAAADAPCEKPPDKKDTFSGDGIEATVDLANSSISLAGTAQGYTIRVSMGLGSCKDGFKAPDCPTADGTLKGTDVNSFDVSIVVTKGAETISSQSYRTNGTTKLTGHVAEDAKLETLDVDDTVKYQFSTGGTSSRYGEVSVDADIKRKTTVKMRTGAYDPGFSSVNASVRVNGATDDSAERYRLQITIARDYDKDFPAIVKKAIDNYRAREKAWQEPNKCAKLEFDPANYRKQLKRNESGKFTGKVKAKDGGATAKEAKWTRTGQSNATFTSEAKGGSTTLNYSRVVKEGPDVTGKYKVTSTAGVAEDTWKQRTSPVIYYKVTDLVYTDSLTYDSIPPLLGCTQSSGQNNVTTLIPSGAPTDGALGPAGPGASAGVLGSLLAKGTIQKNAAYTGCKYNDNATAMVPCNLSGSGSEVFAFLVELSGPAGDGPVTVTWHPYSFDVGNVPPTISPCYPATTQAPAPFAVPATVPRATMTDPGSHTITLDLPSTVDAAGGNGKVHSTAHYAITFMRVNEDGSPYG